jgi:hypothetical protein
MNKQYEEVLRMFRKQKMALLTTGLLLLSGQAIAKDLVAPNCTGCHQSEGSEIWGTIVPGSQTDTTVEVTTGKDVWKVRYDGKSDLDSFASARELRDEKAVLVEFSKKSDGWVYAEDMSYKPSYHFHEIENIITMSDVAQVLKKTPEEGNYMIVDARGYDNFIEGHLPNAELIPYYRLLEYKDRMPADKNTMIIAYCRGFT